MDWFLPPKVKLKKSSGQFHTFSSLKHLIIIMPLKWNFKPRASFVYPITDTDSMQLRVFKVETLLNNAFKGLNTFRNILPFSKLLMFSVSYYIRPAAQVHIVKFHLHYIFWNELVMIVADVSSTMTGTERRAFLMPDIIPSNRLNHG